MELSSPESFGFVLKSLWQPGSEVGDEEERCRINILDTICYKDGRPFRWIFTSEKNGEILKKSNGKINTRDVIKYFRQRTAFLKGKKPHYLQSCCATVYYFETTSSVSCHVIDEPKLSLLLDSGEALPEVLAIQLYIGGWELKGSGLFEHEWTLKKSSNASSNGNGGVQSHVNEIAVLPDLLHVRSLALGSGPGHAKKAKLKILEFQANAIRAMDKRLVAHLEKKFGARIVQFTTHYILNSSWKPFLSFVSSITFFDPPQEMIYQRDRLCYFSGTGGTATVAVAGISGSAMSSIHRLGTSSAVFESEVMALDQYGAFSTGESSAKKTAVSFVGESPQMMSLEQEKEYHDAQCAQKEALASPTSTAHSHMNLRKLASLSHMNNTSFSQVVVSGQPSRQPSLNNSIDFDVTNGTKATSHNKDIYMSNLHRMNSTTGANTHHGTSYTKRSAGVAGDAMLRSYSDRIRTLASSSLTNIPTFQDMCNEDSSDTSVRKSSTYNRITESAKQRMTFYTQQVRQDEGATHTPTPTATGVPTNAKHSNPISTNSLRNTGANKFVNLAYMQDTHSSTTQLRTYCHGDYCGLLHGLDVDLTEGDDEVELFKSKECPHQLTYRSVLLARSENNCVEVESHRYRKRNVADGASKQKVYSKPADNFNAFRNEIMAAVASGTRSEDKLLDMIANHHIANVAEKCYKHVRSLSLMNCGIEASLSDKCSSERNILNTLYDRMVYSNALASHPSRFYYNVPICSVCFKIYTLMDTYRDSLILLPPDTLEGPNAANGPKKESSGVNSSKVKKDRSVGIGWPSKQGSPHGHTSSKRHPSAKKFVAADVIVEENSRMTGTSGQSAGTSGQSAGTSPLETYPTSGGRKHGNGASNGQSRRCSSASHDRRNSQDRASTSNGKLGRQFMHGGARAALDGRVRESTGSSTASAAGVLHHSTAYSQSTPPKRVHEVRNRSRSATLSTSHSNGRTSSTIPPTGLPITPSHTWSTQKNTSLPYSEIKPSVDQTYPPTGGWYARQEDLFEDDYADDDDDWGKENGPPYALSRSMSQQKNSFNPLYQVNSFAPDMNVDTSDYSDNRRGDLYAEFLPFAVDAEDRQNGHVSGDREQVRDLDSQPTPTLTHTTSSAADAEVQVFPPQLATGVGVQGNSSKAFQALPGLPLSNAMSSSSTPFPPAPLLPLLKTQQKVQSDW